MRKLGIPTVIACIIQQAILQQSMPIYELKFTNGSFEYRPGRSPKDAVQKIKEYAEQEYTNTKTEEEQNKEKREEVIKE